MKFIQQIQQLANHYADASLQVDGQLGPKTRAAVHLWWQQHALDEEVPLHERLGVEQATLKAVIEIESPKGAFDRQGRPPILFEAHRFHIHTQGRYTFTHPHLSARYWNRELYTNDEYQRLEEAAQLNREAALKSASWGKYQILGSNYAACGYPTVQSFVEAMRESEQKQDEAFINFIEAHPRMHKALRDKNWSLFAYLYNGPGYKMHKYDERLAQAYKRHAQSTA